LADGGKPVSSFDLLEALVRLRYHQVKFPQAVALLHQWRGLPPILQKAAELYRMQLHRYGAEGQLDSSNRVSGE
jgi:hypothetical protein